MSNLIKKINHNLNKILWVSFFIFLLIIILLTYKNYGIGWDENRFVSTGKYHIINFLKLIGINSNLQDDTSKYYYFDVKGHTASHGILFDVITVGLSLFFNRITYETFHLIRGLLTIPTFLITGLITSSLANPLIGLASMILLLLTPRFWGNIFPTPIDVPTALFFSLATGSFIWYLKSNRSYKKAILLGIPMGIAIVQRLILAYVLLLSLLVLLILYLTEKKPKLKQLIIEGSIISLSSLFFMHLSNPYLFTHPISGLIEMYKLNTGFPFNANVLFDGQSIHASNLPWYYLPKYILITTPISHLILLLVGIIISIFNIFNKSINNKQKTIYLYLLLLFLSPFIINAIINPVLYDSWRMFLFLCVPMTILMGLGLFQLYKLFIGFFKKAKFSIVFFAVFAIALLPTIREMKILHPYEYVYFNSLVGGLKGAEGKYETDYWGLGMKEAILWFNENVYEEGKSYVLMTEADPFSSNYYFKKGMSQTVDYSKADYYISFTRWSKHLAYPGEIINTVKRKGVPLIYIKKTNNNVD